MAPETARRGVEGWVGRINLLKNLIRFGERPIGNPDTHPVRWEKNHRERKKSTHFVSQKNIGGTCTSSRTRQWWG